MKKDLAVSARLRAALKFSHFVLLNPELYPVEQDDDVDSQCQHAALPLSCKLGPLASEDKKLVSKVLGPITQRKWR